MTAPTPEDILVSGLRGEDQKRPHSERRAFPQRRVSQPTYILDPQLRTDPGSGRPCVFIGSVEGDPSSAAEAAAEIRAADLLAQFGLCPGSPPAPARPAPGAAAALAFEQYVRLPTPTFDIPPGYSITGTKTFVIIGGDRNLDPAPIDVFGYAVTLHITSTYDVDWGDGQRTAGIESQGGRGYPDGDIWHVYERTGTYTVTVTQRWTARYDIAGAESGVIADTLATTSSKTLPVQEAQAVIDG